ncbi:hypothetical protein Ctha_1739 [Chloroherpeton thalassium ATCC 35110]|uniref:Lipoprotein n=1 Tax=Chloroherpeton thalassium (strain ATCC 35110 / GB-78) TaxID=517418 RepID=B3QT97_CHLT3|nr:hypothetical protein [Chloroherpeton thalassium]ACF14196.1 hypothetical protein Ctha_1739 [Chloroherpeton thalassium ATCC 35110]
MYRILSFLMILSLVGFMGCGKKEVKQKVQEKEPATLRPYSEPLPDSVKNRAFEYGAVSPDSLAKKLVLALAENDTTKLLQLAVSRTEYLNWIWPEEPASDPKFNIPLEFAWGNLYRDSYKGAKKMLKYYGGKKLSFVSFEIKGESVYHQTYVYHRNPVLVVENESGKQKQIENLGTIVEMNGNFKFLFYKKD